MIAYDAGAFLEAVTEKAYASAPYLDQLSSGSDTASDYRGRSAGRRGCRKVAVCIDCGEVKELLHGRRVCGKCYSARQIAQRRSSCSA